MTTLSKNTPTDADVLDALFWQYADGDTVKTVMTAATEEAVEEGLGERASATMHAFRHLCECGV